MFKPEKSSGNWSRRIVAPRRQTRQNQLSPALRTAAKRGTMPTPSDGGGIKITAEDLANVVAPQGVVIPSAATSSSGAKVYGTINETAERLVTVTAERGSILLQGWFYLGLAGLIGALTGWAIAEPGFVDGPGHHYGNLLMIPLIV